MDIDLTASGMPGGNFRMLTPFQQMQMMYQNQSKVLEEQQRLLMQEQGILVLKMFFVNEEENRRVKVEDDIDYKKLFEYIQHYIQPYHHLKGVRIDKLQYEDEDKEWMNFNCEKEWKDCRRITSKYKQTNVIKIKIFTQKKSKILKEPKRTEPKRQPKKPTEPEPKPREEPKPPEQVNVRDTLRNKYSRQLESLKSMGFYNQEENLRALEHHNGNVDLVVKQFMRV